MDDTATVRMLPCKRARHIKKMAAFDLYLHFPCHIVAPTVRERTFGSFGLPNGRQTTPTMRYCRQAADLHVRQSKRYSHDPSTTPVDYSTKTLDAATRKINAGDGVSGLREGLKGHLLAWYASEISSARGRQVWIRTRNALLENRRALVESGLPISALESSFANMNKSAIAQALPSVKKLN